MLLRFCHIVVYEGELRENSVFVFFFRGGGGVGGVLYPYNSLDNLVDNLLTCILNYHVIF